MKKQVILGVVLTGVLIGGYTGKIYGDVKIMENTLTENEIMNPNEEFNQLEIAKGVLEDTNREDLYDLNDLQDVQVYFGNITNDDEKDVIVTVSFGPRNTIVATYTKEGDEYTYVGDVGNFYEVKNVSFIPIKSLGQDVIIIDEFANQNVGAYETSEFIEGFLFENGEFIRVLRTPIFIEAAWNETWEDIENPDETSWKKIIQTSDDEWKSKNEIALNLVRYQQFLTSSEGDKVTVPKDSTFEKTDQRVITEKFIWSDKWNRFIIKEATENSTGENIAIIEDRDLSPYALAGYVDNSYLIQRKDGSKDILEISELTF